MATLSGASGTPTSITLTVSGMSSTTKYKRKYEYILAGQVMATVTDSTAGTTTAHRVITGLTPDTLYICRVRIYNSSTGTLVAETNSISVRTLAQSTSQATVSILNFLDNLTQLASGSFKGDIGDTFYISAAGTQYQTYSQQYHFLYFRLSSQNYSTEHDASYPIPIQKGQTVKVYYQSKTTTIPIYNYLDGQHTLSDGSVSGTIGNSFFLAMSGTQYQTYSQEYEFQYFRLASEGYATNHAATETIPITSGQAVRVYYQSKTTTIPIYNYLDGQHTLSDGSVSGTIGNSFFLAMSGTQYQTYSQEYEFQYFRLASEGYATNHAATETIPITSGQAVRVYYKTKITAVAPVISGVTLTKNTATVTWDKNGGGYGSWTLYWGKTSYTAIGSQSIGSSPVTVSGLDPGTTYYFWIVNKAGTDSKTSNTVSGDTKAQIAAFAWTSDDAAYIAAGKAVTYLTAASWNRLTAKINEVRAARGYGSISFTTAYAGQTITAAIYNEAANAIGNLAGAGSGSTVSAGTKLEATYFANSYSALKEALNRAISSYNG